MKALPTGEVDDAAGSAPSTAKPAPLLRLGLVDTSTAMAEMKRPLTGAVTT